MDERANARFLSLILSLSGERASESEMVSGCGRTERCYIQIRLGDGMRARACAKEMGKKEKEKGGREKYVLKERHG